MTTPPSSPGGDVEARAGREMNEKTSTPILPMGGGRNLPESPGERSAHVVDFDGPHDRLNPKNWPTRTKLWISIIVCYGTLVATFDSALFAPATDAASLEFSSPREVGILGTSLYVLGFAFGPMVWAPASELIGRRWPLCIGMFGCSIFSVASGTSKDIQTLLITRFFAGVFGASPLCVVPGVLADLYDDTYRGIAISIYALTVFVGPFTAPFIGGFTVANLALGWRWTLYLPTILGLADVALLVIFLPETCAPFILVKKAAIIRRQTGIWSIHAEQEKLEFDPRTIIQKYFTRPIRLLLMEPIVLLISMYMSFIYALAYALLEAYPFVFETIRGMCPGVAGLPFLALIVGQVLALFLIIGLQLHHRLRIASSKTGAMPENRLPPAVIGAPVFSLGLFWFAWTAFNPQVHWMAPTAAGVAIGFGLLSVFLPCFNYLVDAFTPIAASTVAANIMLRSAVAAGFPLFSRQMFENLGVQWAGTLLGCISAVMIPIPLAFKVFGPGLRSKSRIFVQVSS